MSRGAICERWLGSVTVALNVPETREDEGMSYVLADLDTNETFLWIRVLPFVKIDWMSKHILCQGD